MCVSGLQASEVELLEGVVRWGEHELLRRMEQREPNLVADTVHSVSRRGLTRFNDYLLFQLFLFRVVLLTILISSLSLGHPSLELFFQSLLSVISYSHSPEIPSSSPDMVSG